MNKNQEKIIGHVLIDVDQNYIIDEDWIEDKIVFFAMMYPITKDEKKEVLDALVIKLRIRMDLGSCVKEQEHSSWYYTAKKEIATDFWDRYIKYLNNKGFNYNIINTMDKTTDEIIDMLGNPKSEDYFSRRGLIIGDVQSGKTATYTALINKAADAGYKVIILLTGMIEKLRRQTQSRLDEGFVGLDSTAFTSGNRDVCVGVGVIDSSISGWALTSTSSDFNKSTAQKISGRLANINPPVLFVLKKNKNVLEKLEDWLNRFNANKADGKVHLPMLLIDDEADNASVNTKKEDDDPTTINKSIRKLLKLFIRNNYVGFTATPFANVFINPDTTDEMIDDDLFPRDFIYALEAPTNYVGARDIFLEDGQYSYMLKENDDCEYYVPEKHKKDFIPSGLPESLKEAIGSFIIANAIRDLRKDEKQHRSMLVNISRFIAVQNKIANEIDSYVREMQRDIKNYRLIGDKALKHETFSFLKSVYDKHFAKLGELKNGTKLYDWQTIQKVLHEAVASIVVRSINGGNASNNLDYDEHKDDGLRLIAVGGYSLSRGLTLEGLCVSYFYRNSKMYDTLMQMGRWFGYRDGYADICQIWMAEDAINWYSYISEASDELRNEIKKMQGANRTPKDFGLAVRSDKSVLQVTARNKMRTAENYEMTISLNGKVIETPYLYLDRTKNDKNLEATKVFFEKAISDGYDFSKDQNLALQKNYQIINIPKKNIVEYLRSYDSHYFNMEFNIDSLISLISDYDDGTLDNWDVVIASGQGKEVSVFGKSIKCVLRSFAIKKDYKAIQLSGSKVRLGSTTFAKGGLTKEKLSRVEAPEKARQKALGRKKSFSEDMYFNSGVKRNPLLVIYPIELSIMSKNIENKEIVDLEKDKIKEENTKPLIGLSLGIPKIDGRISKTCQYKINSVKYKELFCVDDGYEEIDETLDTNGI